MSTPTDRKLTGWIRNGKPSASRQRFRQVGASHSDARKRATVILIHGNDNQTREMGFLAPLYVLNGVNVVTYDQRGTGESAGSWRDNDFLGPST